MISAAIALDRLRAGNRRFVLDDSKHNALVSRARRSEVMNGQQPFAIILGCSDSRVPAEIIFDQGLGDLFVVRVAGNIAAPSQVGSIEFAAQQFGTRLVVVLGHSMCGAVSATLNELERPTENQSPNLRSIVEHIRPALETLPKSEAGQDPNALIRHAVRANVRASVNHLRQESQVLKQLTQRDGLVIVGAEYALETGVVDWFDGLTDSFADTNQ